MNLRQIQEDAVKRFRITLNEHSKCWSRMHAHIQKRMICKWHPKSSLQATFDLFHEIGHIETTKSGMRRCEEEYHATVFAIELFSQYKLKVPEGQYAEYQRYIWDELDRGIRRGGKNYPTKEQLTLPAQ